MADAEDEASALANVIGSLTRLGMRPTLLMLDSEDGRLRVQDLGISASRIRRASRLVGIKVSQFSMAPDATEPHRRVMAQHETVFVEDAAALAAQVLPGAVRPLMRPLMSLLGYTAIILSPIVVNGSAVGFISVRHDDIVPSDTSAVALFTEQLGAAMAVCV